MLIRALLLPALLCSTALPPPLAAAQVVSLLAGSPLGASGSVNGAGPASRFFTPTGLVALPSGALMVSDFDNGCLRTVNATDAAVRTFLGPLASARPSGLALSPSATSLYMADALNHNILRVTGLLGAFPGWSILAGSSAQAAGLANGAGTSAKFNAPAGLATDSAGTLYVADFENSVIRSVTPGGLVAVFAGSGAASANDGPALVASFWKPSAIAIDGAGNKYVADTWNYRIRLIDPAGVVSTLAGAAKGFADGTGTAAAFFHPRGLTLAPAGLLVSDTSNNALRCIDLATLAVTTLVGNGSAGAANGVGRAATLRAPMGSAVVGGDLILADSGGNALRRVAGLTPTASTPTPTVTPSPTPTATPSASPSAGATPPDTPSGTATASPTATPSASPSASPSPSPSPSPSASASPAATPSATPSSSATPTPTLSAGASPSPSPSAPPAPSGSQTPGAAASAALPSLSAAAQGSAAPAASAGGPLALLALLLLLPLCAGGAALALLRRRQAGGRALPSLFSSPAVLARMPAAIAEPRCVELVGAPPAAAPARAAAVAAARAAAGAGAEELPQGWQRHTDGEDTWYTTAAGGSVWQLPTGATPGLPSGDAPAPPGTRKAQWVE